MIWRTLPLPACGLIALWLCSCTAGSGGDDNTEPTAGPASTDDAPHAAQGHSPAAGSDAREAPGMVASRLRLPDMESLPDDSELEAGRVKQDGGGVIARPPSE